MPARLRAIPFKGGARLLPTRGYPPRIFDEYSFSDDDINLFQDFKLARLRGVDELFAYELNRNPDDLDTMDFSYEELLTDKTGLFWRHINVMEFAKENKLGYRLCWR